MRNRRSPRYCTACGAALAGRELACGQCGAPRDAAPERRDADARRAGEAHSDTNRWIDEGGSLEPERHAPRRRRRLGNPREEEADHGPH